MPNSYEVLETGIYEDSRTGLRYRAEAGTFIDETTAVALGMPGAAVGVEPSRGAATIHNYFPDGAITDDALIDLTNEYDAAKVWLTIGGEEPLARSAGTGFAGAHEVACGLTATATFQGFLIEDSANRYGFGALPPGVYRVGIDVRMTGTGSLPILVRAYAFTPAPGSVAEPAFAEVDATLTGTDAPRRFVLAVGKEAAGKLHVQIRTVGAHVAATLFASRPMISEGDPTRYRDGDADGWTWSGAAHASPSFGPQP